MILLQMLARALRLARTPKLSQKNLSDFIVKTVKTTIAESIKTQRKTDSDSAFIALYGLPEGGDDGKKVQHFCVNRVPEITATLSTSNWERARQ